MMACDANMHGACGTCKHRAVVSIAGKPPLPWTTCWQRCLLCCYLRDFCRDFLLREHNGLYSDFTAVFAG